MAESERLTFFEALGCDLEIIKTVLLLTGARHGTKNQVRIMDRLGTRCLPGNGMPREVSGPAKSGGEWSRHHKLVAGSANPGGNISAGLTIARHELLAHAEAG